jgi:TATA-box binding protein (TBP) (component of TFIID and TFIIIB)
MDDDAFIDKLADMILEFDKYEQNVKAQSALLTRLRHVDTQPISTATISVKLDHAIDIEKLYCNLRLVTGSDWKAFLDTGTIKTVVKRVYDGKRSTEPGEDQAEQPEEPAEEQPAEEQPAEEQPAEEQPAQEQPAQEQPAEEQPAEEQPAEEQPAKKKRCFNNCIILAFEETHEGCNDHRNNNKAIKFFKNGNLHITGCVHVRDCVISLVLDRIIPLLNDVLDDTYKMVDFDVQLVNTNTDIGMDVDQARLNDVMQSHETCETSMLIPSQHPAVRIYRYDPAKIMVFAKGQIIINGPSPNVVLAARKDIMTVLESFADLLVPRNDAAATAQASRKKKAPKQAPKKSPKRRRKEKVK